MKSLPDDLPETETVPTDLRLFSTSLSSSSSLRFFPFLFFLDPKHGQRPITVYQQSSPQKQNFFLYCYETKPPMTLKDVGWVQITKNINESYESLRRI